MKRIRYALSAIFAALLFSSFHSFAQWSSPGVLFPWQAVPSQFDDEDVSPFLASVSDDSGVIHLVWSNGNQGQSDLVYATRQNGAWNEITVISDENPYAAMPSLIIDGDGTLHCAWVEMDFNFNFVIFYSRKPAGLEWETPVIVSEPELLLNTYPQLIADHDDNIRLFYTTADFSGENAFYFLKHSIIDQTNPAEPVEQPVPEMSVENQAFNSKVMTDHEGLLHCAWYDSEGGIRNISTAVFDGTEWGPTTKLVTNGQGTTLQESMPIVLAEAGSGETHAFWAASMIGNGQYSSLDNSTWTPKQNINDPHFRNTCGITDSEDFLHMAGTELTLDGGELFYHVYKNGIWEHSLIEAGTPTSKPDFPVMVISRDTLFCFYVRITEDSGYQLIESYYPLDNVTGSGPSDPLSRISLSVYPNPVTASSVLSLHNDFRGASEVNLYNMAGRKLASAGISTGETGNQTMSWSRLFGDVVLTKGLYLVEVRSNGLQASTKVAVAD